MKKETSKSAADVNVYSLTLAYKGWIAKKPALIIVDMLNDTFNKHTDAFITKTSPIYPLIRIMSSKEFIDEYVNP
jgi:hypothetical protein